jgi:hypothetical protein
MLTDTVARSIAPDILALRPARAANSFWVSPSSSRAPMARLLRQFHLVPYFRLKLDRNDSARYDRSDSSAGDRFRT